MKLTYYGTAAAEAFPAMFCVCESCEKARKAGGRNIRTRSQALINDNLLIDFPADTNLHILNYGLNLMKVKACLITHGHDDHLYPYDFAYRTKHYGHFPNDDADKEPLDVYSTKQSGVRLKNFMDGEKAFKGDVNAVCYHEIEKFQKYDIAGYEVTPLRAKHAPDLDPVIYIIQKDGKSVLYAHDTGVFTDDTWEYIENSGIVFDLVSLDCTSGLNENSVTHMVFNQCIRVKERLMKKNANDKTVFILNHFSHNGNVTYDDMVPLAAKEGFLVSYDGMTVEV